MGLMVETKRFRYRIGDTGENIEFLDKASGRNHCLPDQPCAWIKVDGNEFPVTRAVMTDGTISLEFGAARTRAVLQVTTTADYITFQVRNISGSGVTELKFIDLPLSADTAGAEPFVACALALNGRTNVVELPGINSRPVASCYSRFGFDGWAALVGCPRASLREIIKKVLATSPDLPHSPLGGPWALESADNYRSYIIGSLVPEQADNWIKTLQAFGIDQFDFHGGKSYRFGDFRLDPGLFPEGRTSLKKIIDRFHKAGIQVGLHSYSFFIDKTCPWVTPRPDPRLGKKENFTLATALDATTTAIPVLESTALMSTITGFHVSNSIILQIEDELVEFGDVAKDAPFGFGKCRRGALGTTAAPHPRGTPVSHLREHYGLLVPDGDSTLLTEVAEHHAAFFNECGFDMIYLDALDGAHAIAGPEWTWYYSAKFVSELVKRLHRPVIMEMSFINHHLWQVRSRHGAWDMSARNHKTLVDYHVQSNAAVRNLMFPVNLGWWGISHWMGVQGERTFEETIEYLCSRALATNSGLSFTDGITPELFSKGDHLPRLAAIIRAYETLRKKNACPAAIRTAVTDPDLEVRLTDRETPRFRRASYPWSKIEKFDGRAQTWKLKNLFAAQPLQVRIENLFSVAPFDTQNAILLTDFARIEEFAERETHDGVALELLGAVNAEGKDWSCARYSAWREVGRRGNDETKPNQAGPYGINAINVRHKSPPGCTRITKRFSPSLDFGPDINVGGEPQGLGVWVYGDGRGELLNFQLRSMVNMSQAFGDHYIDVDFRGWRYFELVEHEGARVNDFVWPHSLRLWDIWGWVYHKQFETLNIWYNRLPAEGKVSCLLGPVKALPLIKTRLKNPKITLGSREVLFPVELETGQYLECFSADECRVFDADSNCIQTVKPVGKIPGLVNGMNVLAFASDTVDGIPCRAKLTANLDGGEIT